MNDPEITKAIRGCVSIGAGSMSNVCVNGVKKHNLVTWKNYCIVDPLYGGIICDNKLVERILPSEKWSCVEMTNSGVVINSIDCTLVTEEVSTLKKRTAKKNKVINL